MKRQRLNIRELRLQFNMTQQALAMRLGVGLRTVQRWEAGQNIPSPLAIQQIKELFGGE